MATQYCTQAQIVENLKGVSFSSSTSVTADALTAMIAEESQVIDQHIQGRYAIPITDADALVFLRKIALDLVIHRVKKVLQPKRQLPLPEERVKQDIVSSSQWASAMRMLKMIMKGDMTLPNTDVAATKFFGSQQVDCDTTEKFNYDEEQW